MATPTAVTAQYSDAYISTFDFHKPEKRNTLFRKYGDQGLGMFNILDTMGYQTPVAQTEYSHFEEDWIHQTVSVRNNVASPGAGNEILFTLGTADLDASNRFYIQLNDDVMFANGVTGHVTLVDITTPSAPVITVEPHDSTDNIGALTAGDTVIIYSDNFAEGTGQPDSKVARSLEYSFSTKIVKESVSFTGSEMTNQTWFDKMSDGTPIQAYYLKGQLDCDFRMMLKMDGAMLFDTPTDNATLVAAGNRTTYGLVPWVRAGGNTDNYNATFYSLSDFDTMNNTLDQNFAPAEMLSMLGIQLQQEWENLFVNSFVDGAIVYASFADGKKVADLNIGFKTFSKTERFWHMKRLGVLNNPQLYGAPGFKQPGMGIITPMDSRKDTQSGNMIPSIGMRYKSLAGYNRKMKVWKVGGAKENTNGTDIDFLYERAEIGTEFIASNRFFLVEQN